MTRNGAIYDGDVPIMTAALGSGMEDHSLVAEKKCVEDGDGRSTISTEWVGEANDWTQLMTDGQPPRKTRRPVHSRRCDKPAEKKRRNESY